MPWAVAGFAGCAAGTELVESVGEGGCVVCGEAGAQAGAQFADFDEVGQGEVRVDEAADFERELEEGYWGFLVVHFEEE